MVIYPWLRPRLVKCLQTLGFSRVQLCRVCYIQPYKRGLIHSKRKWSPMSGKSMLNPQNGLAYYQTLTEQVSWRYWCCTGNKRVRFDPKVEEANKQTEKVMSPQRSGIVSAVVDQLRRLSSWGSPKSNSESPKTQLDHPVDAEILADLGMPSKILQKSVRNKSMRKPKGQGKKAPRTTKQGILRIWGIFNFHACMSLRVILKLQA